MTDAPTRTSFTYYLPGGLRAVYEGEAMSYMQWFRETAIGGSAMWRMWFYAAFLLARAGVFPRPSLVSRVVGEQIIKFYRKAYANDR